MKQTVSRTVKIPGNIARSISARSVTLLRKWGPGYATLQWAWIYLSTYSARRALSATPEEIAAVRRQIRGDGFYAIRGFISRDEAREILARVKAFEERGEFTREGVFLTFYENLPQIVPPARLTQLKNQLQPVVERYLGLKLKHDPDAKIYKNSPAAVTSSFLWHHDANFCNVNALIYLTDVLEIASGPLQVIPNSFRHRHVSYSYEGSRFDIADPGDVRSALGSAGDLILFDTASIHRASKVERGDRYALGFYFAPFEFHSNARVKEIKQSLWTS